MISHRVELTIPGRFLGNGALKNAGNLPAPDLVMNLSGRGDKAAFGAFLSGRGSISTPAFRAVAENYSALFFLSDSFLEGLIAELSDIIKKFGISPFTELPEGRVERVKRSSKDDFYIFYSLGRADVYAEKDDEVGALENLIRSGIGTRALSLIMLSGIYNIYDLEADGIGFEFYIKSGNFARLAAELFCSLEKNTGGNVPGSLARVFAAYVRKGTEDVSDEA